MRFNRVAGCLFSAAVMAVALTAFTESALAIPASVESTRQATLLPLCYPHSTVRECVPQQWVPYPENDRDMVKEPPVSPQRTRKEVWPSAIWPSDIPGSVPISVQATAGCHTSQHR
jgi:hypothetical protein